ncbi:MAG: sigma factor [Roseovarius sp.]|jgi:RNA polymerase sigma-70 factor (ECF subfamily)|nr:sigma factor [Roseovarius sp.]
MSVGADSLHAFEAERARLTALAYRMLGEWGEAEDVVQEAWLRWSRATGGDGPKIETPAAWLRQVTVRLAIDALRRARQRRETYVGPWLPEPLLDETNDGEAQLALAQECDLALMWAMERLTSQERAAGATGATALYTRPRSGARRTFAVCPRSSGTGSRSSSRPACPGRHRDQ